MMAIYYFTHDNRTHQSYYLIQSFFVTISSTFCILFSKVDFFPGNKYLIEEERNCQKRKLEEVNQQNKS